MIKWLKKKLGILSLAKRVETLEKDSVRIYKAIGRIDNKARTGRNPQRRDEIERDKKRRRKSAFI